MIVHHSCNLLKFNFKIKIFKINRNYFVFKKNNFPILPLLNFIL